MDLNEIAAEVISGRLEALRALAQQLATQRSTPPEPPKVDVHVPEQGVPVVNVTNQVPQTLQPVHVQLIVPPEAIKVIVETPAPRVDVHVPKQAAPEIIVQPAEVKVEPKIEVNVPEQPAAERPKKARIKHADGSTSTIEVS